MDYSYQIETRLDRLRNLLAVGTLSNSEVQTEVADILTVLKANGISDEVIKARTGF